MKKLADRFIYSMSANNEPAVEIDLDSSIEVATVDAFGGQITSGDDTLDELDMDRLNPATGPIYINKVNPGDTLKISIDDIQLSDKGIQSIVPGFGFLHERFPDPVVTIHQIEDNYVMFDDKNKIPVKPMLGTIGVAPKTGSIPCLTPGSHGGNLDTPDIGPGAILYLPVYHPGALLALGDAHAVQGDGEVCGVGIETGTKTLLTIGKTDREIMGPMVETDDYVITLGSGDNLEEAGKKALTAMIEYINGNYQFNRVQAYKLSTLICDMRISQVVNPLVTVRVMLPKDMI